MRGSLPSVDKIGEGSPLWVAAALLHLPRLENTVSNRRRPSDQVLLCTYVPPHERIHLSADLVAPDLEGS